MRLTPQEPEIGPKDGFTEANDLFGYADFGERFANLVGRIDEPLVIVLDGPWGSGKSVFAKQWAGLLRQRSAPVIEFDAFANDFYEDAFVALSAQIYAKAKEVLSENESLVVRFRKAAPRLAKLLVSPLARVAVRGLAAGAADFEDVKAAGASVRGAIEGMRNESERVVDKALADRLTKADEDREEMAAFKQTLFELAGAMTAADKTEEATGEENQKDAEGNKAGVEKQKREEYPLVFIIDELDRCRPPFALSVIERIKHLFSVEGVCFVLVTHLPQLETAVQGAYGPNIDAASYLQKFYQVRANLPTQSEWREPLRHTYIRYLWKTLGIKFLDVHHHKFIIDEFQQLADVHDLSLREIQRALTNVSLTAAAATKEQLFIVSLAPGLCLMKEKRPNFYRKARSLQLTWPEAYSFLTGHQEFQKSNAASSSYDYDSTMAWWAYCLGEENIFINTGLLRPSIPPNISINPTDVIPLMCRYIDGFSLK